MTKFVNLACKMSAVRLQINSTLYLRKDKPKKDGSMPVYIRFSRIGSVEPKFPLGITVHPNDWDDVTHRPKTPALKIIADKKVTRIEQCILNAVANDEIITVDLLRRFVNERDQSAASSFYTYFNEYVQKQTKRGKMSESTRVGYDTTFRLLKEYRKEIKLSDISTKLLDGFDQFMIKRGQQNGKGDVKGSRSNRIKQINAVLHYIERQGIKIDNPYRRGELEVPQADVNDVFLDADELSRLVELFMDTEAGSTDYRVLCMFLFSCATGLRLGDTMELKWRDVDMFNVPIMLEKVTQKTGRKLATPVPELGVEMLQYASEGNPDNIGYDRPVFLGCHYSAPTINGTLRKLAARVGIDKHISYHCSRRTYITLARMAGVDEYALMNYAGHTNPQMTRRYMKWDKKLATESAKKMELFKLQDILRTKK